MGFNYELRRVLIDGVDMGYIKLIVVEVLIYYLLFIGYHAFGAELVSVAVTPDNADISDFIVLDSEDYSISAAPANLGRYRKFVVTLPDDNEKYNVSGIMNLYKVTREIGIISEFMRHNDSSQLYTGGKNSVKSIGRGWKQLAVHPGDSAVATGQALGRVGRTVGRAFKGTFVRKPRSSTDEHLGKRGDGITGEQARQLAYEMHLDVYSKNPYLREFIGKPAFKRWIGRQFVVMQASMLPGGALFMRLSSTVGKGAATYELKIKRLPSAELIIWLKHELSEQLGLDDDSAEFAPCKEFLANPNYTPRQKAYAVYYLTEFHGNEQLLPVMTKLASAVSVDQADYMFYQLLFLWAYHLGNEPIAALQCYDSGIAGTDVAGRVILFFPCDYVASSEVADKRLLGQLRSRGGTVWAAGNFSAGVRGAFQRSGRIEVHPYLLRDKMYVAALNNYITPRVVVEK